MVEYSCLNRPLWSACLMSIPKSSEKEKGTSANFCRDRQRDSESHTKRVAIVIVCVFAAIGAVGLIFFRENPLPSGLQADRCL